MIWLGLCLLTLILTIWDREARPWALTVSGGVLAYLLAVWLSPLYFPFFGPPISLFICCVTLAMFLKAPTRWKSGVHALAVTMLLFDGYLFLSDVMGVYVGTGYATLSNAGLFMQLVLIGHRGAWNATVAGTRLLRMRRADLSGSAGHALLVREGKAP